MATIGVAPAPTMASAIVDHLLENVSGTPIPHGIMEALLIGALIWIMLRKAYDPSGANVDKINDRVVSKMLKDWTPEPLVADKADDRGVDCDYGISPLILTGKPSKFVRINDICCLNMATNNFLDFIGHADIEKAAIETVEKYGVGSCGPRGFYGTVDVHLTLEEQLASFMGMEESAVYSYGFSTVASVIPAYAKRADVIFVDKEVNFAIQKGLDASRSTIVFFEHNNVLQLEQLLKNQEDMDMKNPKKASTTRRFLIVEGIYMNTGTICPLPELMSLKKRYKLRIFIDESISFGTLGTHGRGVTEHFGVPVNDVDLIIGSLEWAVGSIGGFSVGSSYIVEHQRLSALGYCFSASLPPMLAAAASAALKIMEKSPAMFSRLKLCSQDIHQVLHNVHKMRLSGHPESPVKHLFIEDPEIDLEKQKQLLAKIVEFCFSHYIAVVISGSLDTEHFPRRPSLRIAVNNDLSEREIGRVRGVIEAAAKKFL